MLVEFDFQGALTAVAIATVLLTLLISPILRRLYRKAVTRAMAGEGAPSPGTFQVPAPSKPNSKDVSFATEQVKQAHLFYPKLALRYFVAALGFALVFSVLFLWISDLELLPVRTLTLMLIFAIPAVIFSITVLGASWWWGVIALAANVAVVFVAAGNANIALAYLTWVFPPSVCALILASPYMRTTTLPILFISALLAVSLLFVLELALFFVSSGIVTPLLAVFPSGVVQILNLGLSAGLVLFVAAVLGVLGLRLVARGLTGASEIMMQADVLLGLQTIWMILVGWGDVGAWGVIYGLAFVAYRLSLRVWPTRASGAAPLLLLLRVFGNQKGQETLSRNRLLAWRQKGPVLLIGAADLATETMDATEMAAFLNRRLDRLFISTPADLEASLNAGIRRAADGLYPVRDYYCRNSTWQPTVQCLMQQATDIILDMRGFGVSNLGVQFEINELAHRVPAKHITVLVNGSTDVELAQTLFRDAWQRAGTARDVPDSLVFERMD